MSACLIGRIIAAYRETRNTRAMPQKVIRNDLGRIFVSKNIVLTSIKPGR